MAALSTNIQIDLIECDGLIRYRFNYISKHTKPNGATECDSISGAVPKNVCIGVQWFAIHCGLIYRKQNKHSDIKATLNVAGLIACNGTRLSNGKLDTKRV